jgi:hypothetical protein
MADATASAEEQKEYCRQRKSEEIGKFVSPDAHVHNWLLYLRMVEFCPRFVSIFF